MSVVVPFAGSRDALAAVLRHLAALVLLDGDELIVVDNSAIAVTPPAEAAARVARAPAYRSSYYARNVGAELAANDWLLFLDADVRPPADLLDRYFDPPPADDAGAVAGEVHGDPRQDALTARYARSRRHLRQEDILERPQFRPMAVTANLLVRRSAWESLGGFQEGMRSGGDADFSFRLQDAGWTIGLQPGATVEHAHRETVTALARQAARIGAGRAWLARRHDGYRFPNPARQLLRSLAGVVAWTLLLRFERAVFKALDGVFVGAEAAGYLLPNAASAAPPPARAEGPRVVFMLDEFALLTETFVAGEALALARAGHPVRVEAGVRPRRPNREPPREIHTTYLEDDGIVQKAIAMLSLAVRHPLGVARDLLGRRRWAREEPLWPLRALAPCARRIERLGDEHLHVHFAGSAALNAMRLGRILGRPYSVTAHAYDIFLRPANLPEKLRRAAFATGESGYATEELRRQAGPKHAGRIRLHYAGVDGERFHRHRPYPGGHVVLAVGRLIEKKGFAHLVEATAVLAARAPLDAVLIVGDGPLRDELAGQAARLGVGETVQLLGARDHNEVQVLLEDADVLAMPCVVAADGDRDSLPNVVYEALAMEVPVVASAEVGLPEVIRPEWGRLAPPGDVTALAAALEDLLALPPERRAEMGRAGREFVLREHDVGTQAERLAALIAGVQQGAPAP